LTRYKSKLEYIKQNLLFVGYIVSPTIESSICMYLDVMGCIEITCQFCRNWVRLKVHSL